MGLRTCILLFLTYLFSNHLRIINTAQIIKEKNDLRLSLVSIQEHSKHICSGYLVSDNLVLTPAHCIYHLNSTSARHQVSDLRVLLGVRDSNYSKLSSVELANLHPRYEGYPSLQNDVAILTLKKDENNNTDIPLWDIPTLPVSSRTNRICMAIGLRQNTTFDNHMEVVHSTAKLLPNEDCARMLFDPIGEVTPLYTCTRGIFDEDLGALLLCDGKYVGVLSFSACREDNLTMWTLVNTYTNWMNLGNITRHLSKRNTEDESDKPQRFFFGKDIIYFPPPPRVVGSYHVLRIESPWLITSMVLLGILVLFWICYLIYLCSERCRKRSASE